MVKHYLITSAALSLLAYTQTQGALILSEDFNDPDNTVTRSTTPPIGPAWTGSNGMTTRENRLNSGTSGSGHVLSSNFAANYFVDNPGVYTLSADVFLATTMVTATDSWQIGFNNATSLSPGANRHLLSTDGYAGAPAIILTGQGRVIVKRGAGVNLYDSGGTVFPYAPGTEYNLKIVLDTMPTLWTVNAFVDDTQIDLNGGDPGMTFTYDTNPTIRYPTIGSNIDATDKAGGSYLDNFQLDVVPEPASLAMVGFLAGGLLRRRR